MSESMPRSANEDPALMFFVFLIPRILATASGNEIWLPAAAPFRLTATTIEASTGWGCCRKISIVFKQDTIRWGSVPPTSVSLSPLIESIMRPTSPMAPHWIAAPGRPRD
uniref:Secreted protein n=1 Tax=Cacopsylla melanoneura TaxID=428564 RepID=A0A8D8LEH4_9HEMI